MSAPDHESPTAPKCATHAIPQPTGDRIVDLLAERRAVITEQRHETDQTAIEMLGHDIDRIDRELAAERARVALDALTGPERVEVLRHYASSARRALVANRGKRAECGS